METLPPDLDRLGDQLASAAAGTLERRRRRREQRRRLATAGVVGAIAFAALTPAELGPAIHNLTAAGLASAAEPPGCEHSRGPGFMLKRCEAATAAEPHRPYAWR